MYVPVDKSKDPQNETNANTVAHYQTGGKQRIRFEDSRPEAMTQRKLQEMARHSTQGNKAKQLKAIANFSPKAPPAPIQKMAAVAIDNKSEEEDFIVASSLNYALQTAGGPLADFGVNSDFSGMGTSEQLIIVHHGEPGKIGDYDGTQTADILTQQGKAIPKDIGGVTLMSCYSGIDEHGPDSSLTDQVANNLKEKGYTDIPIKGAMGPAIASSATSARAVKPSKVDEVGMEVQNALLFKYNFVKEEKDGVATKIKTVDEILTDNQIDPSKMSIEEKISKIGALTSNFYTEFIQMASQKGYLLDQGKDGVEVTWATK